MVILDNKDYIDEAKRHLNDANNYKHLDFDSTELQVTYWKNKIRNKQLKNENLLSSKTANSLLEKKIKAPELQLLTKIRKANNPGSSVISSANCYTSRVSEFVDSYLRPDI